METKHTNGEWYVGVKGTSVYSENNSTDLKIDVICDSKEEAQANAKLIAAAPDLLEALILIRDLAADNNYDIEDIDEIVKLSNNAIKKATT